MLIEYVFNAIEYISQSQIELCKEMLDHYPPFSKRDIKSSAICLFKSIQMFKQRSIPSKPLHQIMQSRVICSLHLQLFGLYTSINNHDLALIHIKEAFNKSEEILSKCTSICNKHLHRHKNLFPSVSIIS